MCGIAGFILDSPGFGGKEAADVLSRMCRTIRHRGPDDYGAYTFGFADGQERSPKVGLGHDRLSIIDLSASGHQPMSNEDGSVWLAYNGEVYNFRELREQLALKGHTFRSRTDTEAIIHAYEEWGADCVSRFNGMFAFALWDEKKNLLMLARDRIGKKPLYYYSGPNGIVFASEPKAILAFPGFQKQIDMASLQKYLLYEYVPSPNTIYKGIKRLGAGSIMIWHDGALTSNKYWDITFASAGVGDKEAAIKDLLEDSVRLRLVSDVPLGIFLSGGIDSSSITGLAACATALERVKTFTIGFDDKSFDEAKYASRVASYFNTSHHEKILGPCVLLGLLPEVMDFMDEPFADASIIPTYMLSKFTRENVKVALSGDGGDELFCGYDTFQAHKLARVYKLLPLFLSRGLIEKAVRRMPVSLDNMSLDFKLKQFIKGARYGAGTRNQVWLGSFAPDEQGCILKDGCQGGADILEDMDEALKGFRSDDETDLITYLYCKFYLQDDILVKTDRASMACSLEVRAPLLDYRFIELALGIPHSMKMKGLATKYIFKKAMKRVLPADISRRPKKGFGIPVAKWIKTGLKGLVTDQLSFDKIRSENLLDPGGVTNLLSEHLQGKKDNRKQLWTLLMFEMWYSRWFKG